MKSSALMLRVVIATLIATFALGAVGQAANLFWDGTDTTGNADGGNGLWDTTAANWDTAATGGANAVWSNATPDTAVFGGTVGTATLSSNVTAGSLTFNTGGYTIAQDGGNLFALTIGTGGVNLTTGLTATINAKLTGNNAWQAFRSSGNGTLTIGGSVANDSTGTITTSLPGHLILAKTGGVAATAGNLVLDNNPVHLELGNQSIGGTTTFNVSTNSRLHTRGFTYTTRGIIGTTGVIENSSTLFGDAITGNGVIKIVTQSGDNFSYSGFLRNVETAAGQPAGQTISVIKEGLGTQTLSGANITYTGTTTVNGGTLVLDLAARTGTINPSTSTTVGALGTFTLSNTNTGVDNTLIQNTSYSGSGTIVKTGAGYLTLHSGSSIAGFTGNLDVQQGTLSFNNMGAGATAPSVNVNIASGATLDNRFNSTLTFDKLTGSGTLNHSFTDSLTVTIGGNNGSSQFDGNIQNSAGTLGLAKAGTGTLILNGTLSYTGNTTVNNGALTIGGTASLGGTSIFVAPATNGSATLNVVSGATLSAANLYLFQNNVNNSTATFNQSGGTVTLTGTFQPGASTTGGSSGNVNIANFTGGTFTAPTIHLYKWATTTLNLSGPAVVNATTMDLGWVDSSPTGTINLGDGSTFSGGTNINNGGTSGVLNVGSFTLRSNRNYTLNFKGGTLKASAGGASWLQATQFTTASVQDAGGIIDNGGNAITISQVLSHGGVAATDGGLIFQGAGTTTLNAANTYNGGSTVRSGTLTLTNNTAAGSGTIRMADAGTGASNTTLNFNVGSGTLANAITVNNLGTGTVTLNQGSNFSTLSGLITLNRPTTISSTAGDRTGISGKITGNVDTLTFTGGRTTLDQSAANASDFMGNVLVSTGTLQVNSIYALPSTADVTVNTGALFRLVSGAGSTVAINGLNGAGGVNGDSGGANNLKTLSVGNNNGSGSFSGAIADDFGPNNDTVAFTKNGTGTQTLSGSNTYSGVTNVNNGTLLVDGTHTGGGLYTVANNATLGGIGSTSAPVTVQNGSKLAPGNSLGPGDFGTGNLLLSSGSILEVNLDGVIAGTQYDQVDVTGSVNVTGSLLDVILGFAPSLGGSFTIIDNDGSDAVVGTFSGLSEGTFFSDGGQQWMISYLGGTGNDVVLTATPEPSAFVCSLAGLFAVAIFAWRERRRASAH